MENFDEDDDTHYCNKCHETIQGLDNYVRHRRSECRTTGVVKPDESYHCPPSTSEDPPYPEILNADFFFSSLELQSSTKTLPRQENDMLGVRTRNTVKQNAELRKRKNLRKDKSPEDKEDSKEKLTNLLPVDLDDLGLPSLYPDIVVSASTSKATTSSVMTSSKQSSYLKIDNTDRKRHDNDHNQDHDQDHQQDWLADFSDTHEIDLKEVMGDKQLQDGAYDVVFDFQEEDFEEDSADDGMVEDDFYSDSEDADDDYPPRDHTGGKWKPEHQQDEEMEEVDQNPPQGFTGGKWKPIEQKYEVYEVISGGKLALEGHQHQESEDTSEPPPSHTRGKWIPGDQIGDSSGYWCTPCGRKLASRVVYNRHLKSDLHARRSIQELDEAVQIPKSIASTSANTTSPFQQISQTKRQKALKRKLKIENAQKATNQEEIIDEDLSKIIGGRKREKMIVTCELCHVRVRRAQMGKHLLSYYHSRVASASTDQDSEKAQRFLLNNMPNIVRQCPFQCASCRFYCNTEETFLMHWRSNSHKETVNEICGSFVCTLCDYWCDDNESMEKHIMKQGHQDVVSMINGSVPIVIRRQRVLTCSSCCRGFRYNIQLRVHAKETGHEVDYSASDEHQSRLSCSTCGQVLRSLLALQRHQLTYHRDDASSENAADGDAASTQDSQKSETLSTVAPYFCSYCSIKFETPQEAVLHRRTVEHKQVVRQAKAEEGLIRPRQWDCICDMKFTKLNEFRVHILKKHPKLCHSCPTCGKKFALSQDASRHTRIGGCSVSSKIKKRSYFCSGCSFNTDSRAEFLFHNALHAGPVENTESSSSTQTLLPRYKCEVCHRLLAKTTLRDHLRKHTGERPFPCPNCGLSFPRRTSLNMHIKECFGNRRPRNYLCEECGSAFHSKSNLKQHMLRHIGKTYQCHYPGCPTILRTETELKNHHKIIHEMDERPFKCNDCKYAGKTKTQLMRHCKSHQDPLEDNSRIFKCDFPDCYFQTKIKSHITRHAFVHNDDRPYKCRHCSYDCNNLENLRKHHIASKKHPGKMIYECESCNVVGREPFETNFAKELKAHLIKIHPDIYPTPNDASDYIATIFKKR